MEPRDEGLEGVTCDYETPEGPCDRGWGHNGDHDPFYLIRNPAGDTLPSSEVVIARLRAALTVASEMENSARESLYALQGAAQEVCEAQDRYLLAHNGQGHEGVAHDFTEPLFEPLCGNCVSQEYGTEATLFEYAIPALRAALAVDAEDVTGETVPISRITTPDGQVYRPESVRAASERLGIPIGHVRDYPHRFAPFEDDGIVQRGHAACCWCGDHHEAGK